MFDSLPLARAPRYAFRKEMTDVVIQDLTSHNESRIKCRDLVKKIAIYQDQLAVCCCGGEPDGRSCCLLAILTPLLCPSQVQLPHQINLYELFSQDGNVTKFRIKVCTVNLSISPLPLLPSPLPPPIPPPPTAQDQEDDRLQPARRLRPAHYPVPGEAPAVLLLSGRQGAVCSNQWAGGGW